LKTFKLHRKIEGVKIVHLFVGKMFLQKKPRFSILKVVEILIDKEKMATESIKVSKKLKSWRNIKSFRSDKKDTI